MFDLVSLTGREQRPDNRVGESRRDVLEQINEQSLELLVFGS